MDPANLPRLPASKLPERLPPRPRRRPGQVATCDTTYRDALGAAAWARLAPEVRQRFSVRPGPGECTRYRGTMHLVELSFAGWVFAQFCRLFGTPLAPWRGRNVAMDIDLAWDGAQRGIAWHRTYRFSAKRVFTVRSTKCAGDEGDLVEHIGHGFSMRMTLSERAGKLLFTSTRYECRIGGHSIRLPDLLTPGITTVVHEQLAGDRFRFILSVDHPILGNTVYQDGEFYSSVSDR